MVIRLSTDARKTVLPSAAQEARRRGDRRLGTDHLLLGLLHDADSPVAEALGVDLETARAALDGLDRSALASLGVEVSHLGHPSGLGDPAQPAHPRRLLPLTSGARAVIRSTVEQTRHTRTARIETSQFLLALLDRKSPDPAADLLTTLGVNRSQIRSRLGKSGDRNQPES
jgi:ATP-dependent Clp protease ATP-binding subunit ClpA